jgi:phage terminase small subunit
MARFAKPARRRRSKFAPQSTAFILDPPEPPHHLDDDAQCKWRQTWPRLHRNRRDGSSNRDTLAQYCEAWAAIRLADREIKELEHIRKVEGGSAAPGEDPKDFHRQRLTAMARFDRAGEELGLSLYDMERSPWGDYGCVLMQLPPELAAQDEKQADPAAPRRPRIWTLKRLWAALQRSCGNIAAAARVLSETYGVTCTPATIYYLVNKYPQLREGIDECKLVLFDICKVEVMNCARAGDAASQEFLLCMYDPRFQ